MTSHQGKLDMVRKLNTCFIDNDVTNVLHLGLMGQDFAHPGSACSHDLLLHLISIRGMAFGIS